jgi:hypothetical protein
MQQLEHEFACMQQAASSAAVDSLVVRLESVTNKHPTHMAALEFLLTTPPQECLNQHLHAIVYLLNSKQLLFLSECEYSGDTIQNEHYQDANDGSEPLEHTHSVDGVLGPWQKTQDHQDTCNDPVLGIEPYTGKKIEVATPEIHEPLDVDPDAAFFKELEQFGLGTDT